MTVALIIVPTVFFLMNVASVLSPAVVVLATLSCIALLCVFLTTACSDPGIVFSDDDGRAVDEERAELASSPAPLMCSQCKVPRPASASHCYECNLCVDKLDHHCPWTGKCIGKKNLYFFYGFLWLLTLHIALVVAACVFAFATQVNVFHLPSA